MFRTLRCRWRLTLFVAAVVPGTGTAQAHQMLYDQDGYRLAVGIESGVGGFFANNVDFGAGDVNTNAPLRGSFPPSERRTTRDWFEGFVKPFAELETPFFAFGHTYGLVSIIGALTRGDGDATSSLAPQGGRSTTSDGPQRAAIEDAVIGWHSGNLFADSLGEDALEISGGRQSLVLGDAFLVGTGVANGFRRAALYFQPRTSFDGAAILKLNLSPMRAKLFNLENRVNQDLMQGFDQPKTKFLGVDIALFEAGEAEPSLKAAGEKEAPKAALAVQTTRVKKEVPDLWSAGFDFLHVYGADSTPGTFSFPPGEPSPTLSVYGNRKGLNVYSGYLAGSFLNSTRTSGSTANSPSSETTRSIGGSMPPPGMSSRDTNFRPCRGHRNSTCAMRISAAIPTPTTGSSNPTIRSSSHRASAVSAAGLSARSLVSTSAQTVI